MFKGICIFALLSRGFASLPSLFRTPASKSREDIFGEKRSPKSAISCHGGYDHSRALRKPPQTYYYQCNRVLASTKVCLIVQGYFFQIGDANPSHQILNPIIASVNKPEKKKSNHTINLIKTVK